VSEEDFLAKASSEVPWFAKAPAYLAIGIVGVPSMIALASVYFVGVNITRYQKTLEQYNLSEIHMLNEQNNQYEHNFAALLRFMEDDLKAQYQTCIESAKTATDRARCISPESRMKRYGIEVADPP
jgi:hypothetical protein